MGIEIGVLAAAASAAATVVGVIQQNRAAAAAASARKKASSIQSANEQIRDRLERRRAAREERIRRARLIQGAETVGASGSSALAGAQASLGSNYGAAVAQQASQRAAAQGISAALQKEANANAAYQRAGQLPELVNSIGNFAIEFNK